MTPRVALATCAAFPALAEDDPRLIDALQRLGIDGVPAIWDDREIDWQAFDLVVIRSTWDYAPRRDEYLAWTASVPRLLNSAEVVAWNTDKHYLSAVEYAVPTQFLGPGDPWQPPGGEYVIKPTVSAGSRDTARYGPGDEAAAVAHAGDLISQGRTLMVQPYLRDVDRHGETALVYIGGSYSHGIRKGQLLHRGVPPSDGIYLEEDISPTEPDHAERRVAEEILDSLAWPRDELLYARVDLIWGPDGTPKLVELELTEPSLFLSFGERAAERLAAEIAARL